MAELIPFNSAEKNNETSWYTAFGAGIASGLIKIPEGIVSLGAELIDLGADTNTAASVEQFFDKINPFEEIAEERTIGKLAEIFTQIGIPGTAGFKAASGLANKAIRAKKLGAYANFGRKSKEALEEVQKLNKSAGYRKFVAGIMGGATGEAFITDADKIGSFGDLLGGPTALDRDETYGKEEASRRLLNRLKFGSESLLVTPVIAGVGIGAKALAQRGKELAYSDSAFERWIDRFIGSPFRPRGDLPEEVFKAEMTKAGLKARDIDSAKEIVNSITREVDKVFPEMDTVFNKTTKQEKDKFLDLLNKSLFEGDITKPINPKAMDDIVKEMDNIELNPEARQRIVGAIDAARGEFTNLVNIFNKNVSQKEKGKLKSGVAELQEILKDRIQGWVGSTYRAFEPKSKFLKTFRRYQPTEEAYGNAISLFRRYLAKTDPTRAKDTPLNMAGTDYYMQAKYMVDDILEQGQKAGKKAKALPDLNYTDKTAQGIKTKSFEAMLQKTGGKGSKVIRDLFGEIRDPRYSIFNAMTNLSSATRTATFFDDIVATNSKLQAAGQRGAFWADEGLAKQAVRSNQTGIQVVKVGDYLTEGKYPGIKYVDNELLNKYTTKEIAEGMLHANDVPRGLAGALRGRESASTAEAAATYLYRTLLLAPKAASQMAKTILSIPTHLRNLISAGMFTVANGTIAEPIFYKSAFKQGITNSGLLKLGSKGPVAQKAYQELLELGVVNSQVQIGDLTALFKDVIQGGDQFITPDTILKSFFKRMKKVGSFLQGKYVAEDDVFKITNYITELERLKIGRAKQLGIKRIDLDATLDEVTERQLKQQAADIVKNTVPNYSYVGSAVKTSRLLPIGNFMSFPSEMIRTTAGIAKQGISELRHSRPTRGSNIGPIVFDIEANAFVKNDNPMYATGIKRIAGMTTALTVIPPTLTEGMKALYDVTEDEMQALRQFVPEWSKNSTLLPMRDDNGDLRYIDFSHSNVYDTVARPFRTLLNNVFEARQNDETILAGFSDGITEATAEIMNPFISESIWTEAWVDLTIRSGRTPEGKVLYTDETPFGDKAAIKFIHLGEALLPAYKQFTRPVQALLEIPSKRGEQYEIGPELGGLIGFRAIKIDPLDSMGFKIAEYQEGIRNARREFTGGYFGLLRGGPIKANDVIERFYESNKARFNVQREMYKNLNAANILGVSDGELRKTFAERQLSQDAFRKLKDGKFEPYFPSEDIEKRFKEIADNLGDIDVFKEIKFDLREMQRDMKQINLDEPFDLDLTDYLEEGPSIAESLGLGNIGQTPMPSPQVIQTSALPGSNVTSQGLTPTELALLSPEEQQIRLRQRGLA
jgi:hypothetical protein